ncbi:Phosphatidylinositol 4,5-bisphosphate 5-phosphatase INP51 [Dictyocoela muelleri]|nr:Phosphatidylinositol 4,5-bisphosphate 5-phosphatase INP51 [Dictyocoela muelleri]
MNLQIVTWNIYDTKKIIKGLKLIKLKNKEIIIIALQESYQFFNPFYRLLLIKEIKNIYHYKNVKVDRFFGLCTIILTNLDIDVKTTKIGTGLLFIGNKGILLSRIYYKDEIIVFANLHLHHNNYKKQIMEIDYCMDVINKLYGDIINRNLFNKKINNNTDNNTNLNNSLKLRNIYKNDDLKSNGIIKLCEKIKTIILAGDFNFRVDFKKQSHIKTENMNKENDKFYFSRYRNPLDNSFIFLKKYPIFKEKKIKFLPTYKYIPGTNNYDESRVPSWCDRIFVASSYEYKFSEYSKIDNIIFSDHKPVTVDLTMTNNFLSIIEYKKYHEYPGYGLIVSVIFGFLYDYYFYIFILVIWVVYFHSVRNNLREE